MEELYLSVNVEPKDFIYMNVPKTLRSVCERYGVSVCRVHVEITERGFSSDLFSPELFIDLLHKDGVTVEIDDFGKGSSSLALFKDLTVDILKLDMAFIQDCGHEQRRQIVLESIVDMARKLKTCVIAEGVETTRQWKTVQDVGCDGYQGFLFSKPLPVKEFEIFYQEHNKRRLC
jgi:EAL domain-containing protein (putative c-di-GMP-specific phosphodiesterase class I)